MKDREAKGQNITKRPSPISSPEVFTRSRIPNPPRLRKNLILKTLQETNWNKHRAAKRLNINRSTLYGKMKRHRLEKEQN